MKILAFVDLHNNAHAFKALTKKIEREDPDVIIAAGDLTVFQDGLDNILFELNRFGKPVLVIHGNHETEEDIRKMVELFDFVHYIHEGVHELERFLFLGYGGGGFSKQDHRFKSMSKKLRKHVKKGHQVVMVFHQPPHGTLLDQLSGEHHGNKSYREFIEDLKPLLVICGHFHENAGKEDRIGDTRIVNPGPEGLIIEV